MTSPQPDHWPLLERFGSGGRPIPELVGREVAGATLLRRLAPAHRRPRPLPIEFEAARRLGRFCLLRDIESGPPDQCYMGWHFHSDFWMFFRAFDPGLLDARAIEGVRLAEAIRGVRGIETFFWADIGEVDGAERAFLASLYEYGANVSDLERQLDRRTDQLSWGIALAIFAEARGYMRALHDAGLCHGALGPKQIRLSLSRDDTAVTVCLGRPLARGRASPLEDRLALGRAILPLAAQQGERELVGRMLSTSDPNGFAVLSDFIQERAPDVAEVAVELLWREAGLDAPDAVDRVLAACVNPAEIRDLWSRVCEVAAEQDAAPGSRSQTRPSG